MQKLSRSKIDLFVECPRCFWLEVRQGVKRPSFPPYTINNAVDYLLKQEFDIHREKRTSHPVMKEHGIAAVPFQHPNMNKWRHNFTGVQYHHEPTDFMVFGAVDDIWVDPKGRLMIVDYKATGANEHRIYDSYQRQMEIYQWLVANNGFEVLPTGYFLFARVNKGEGFGDGSTGLPQRGKAVLPFDLFLEPYEGDRSWIDEVLEAARGVYDVPQAPVPSLNCEYCSFAAKQSRFKS
jgi:CRISPR/Cas system-associated exonuclease Cas4 (RecB family)